MANRRVPLLDGYYLDVCKPDGPNDGWCVTLEHETMDTEMNDLDCSITAFNTRRTAIGNAIVDLLQSYQPEIVPSSLYTRMLDADPDLVAGGRQYALDELKAKYLG